MTNFDLNGLLELWARRWEPGPDAETAFGRFYADPVRINGSAVPLSALVARAAALNAALTDIQREVLTALPGEHGVAVEFRITGRHVGPLSTTAGMLPATGRTITMRVIDILTVIDDRITEVAMVADELAVLVATDSVTLIASGPARREGVCPGCQP